jgi:hypothetical protein
MPPPIDVSTPGRRWVVDDAAGNGSIWVLTSNPLLDPKILIEGRQPPPFHAEADVLAAIQKRWPGAVVCPAPPPGERHPRIWRGSYSSTPSNEVESFFGSLASASVCFDRFRQVLRTIEPERINDGAFGHELRQLIVIAATEVESAWRAILVANNYRPGVERFTTNDYCKLLNPLKLDQWEVVLAMAPRYGNIAPFKAWDSTRPTASLRWYDAYNKTKHDREQNLKEATLAVLIETMAALYVMLAAQAGPNLARPPYPVDDFSLVRQPSWAPSEEYVPAISFTGVVREHTLVPYPFPP